MNTTSLVPNATYIYKRRGWSHPSVLQFDQYLEDIEAFLFVDDENNYLPLSFTDVKEYLGNLPLEELIDL